MFPPGKLSPHARFHLAVCLILAAGSGCGVQPSWFRNQEGPRLDPVSASELRPGCYCEIDMVVPPTAPDGSFDCYKGTVKEVNQDEVVLTNALQESCIEYGANARRRAPTQQKRDLVRVPLTGVDTIWALPRGKDEAVPSPAASPLPSQGMSPPAAHSSTEEPGGPSATGHFSAPSQPDMPARFDAQPTAGNAVR
jgi:hypothetical protein